MLITKLPDGSTLFEVRGDQFSLEWKSATREQRVVLPDKRPAVRKADSQGVTFTTIHPYAWEVLRALPRNRAMVKGNIKLCEFCGSELTVSKEYESCWCFTCPACKSVETHSKHLIGGTLGAGEKEKT